MRILFAAAPGYGLMLPLVPLVWAARAAGHEILVATTAYMTKVGAESGLPIANVFPRRDVGADLMLAAAGKAPGPAPPISRTRTCPRATGNWPGGSSRSSCSRSPPPAARSPRAATSAPS